MKLNRWLFGTASAVALGLAATTLQAFPASGVSGNFKSATEGTSAVEKAYYRCGWRYGRRVCWRIGPYPYAPYPYYYAAPYPYPYPYYYGSYGPSIGFYWGRGFRRHW